MLNTRQLKAINIRSVTIPALSVFLGLCLLLFSLLMISPSVQAHSKEQIDTSRLPVAAAQFDSHGRLWRLLIGQYHVYVDYSDDLGQRFSQPVAVNSKKQNILATAEDRPALAIANDGRMVVIYASNKPYNYSRYYSHSKDGRSFSDPVLISGKDKTRTQSENRALFTQDGQIYLFWLQAHRGHPSSLAYTAPQQIEQPLSNAGTLVGNMCDCCRLGLSLDHNNRPVVLARFLFARGTRDMGMVGFTAQGQAKPGWRVSDDEWHINACPHHGPSLSIDAQGRQHMVWFTQGEKRKGLFYAHSDDQGKNFSPPLAFGNKEALASHADVLSLGKRVVIVWREFDGEKTSIRSINSHDAGQHWSAVTTVTTSRSDGDHPFLISNGKQIYLSWNAGRRGYQLLPLNKSGSLNTHEKN